MAEGRWKHHREKEGHSCAQGLSSPLTGALAQTVKNQPQISTVKPPERGLQLCKSRPSTPIQHFFPLKCAPIRKDLACAQLHPKQLRIPQIEPQEQQARWLLVMWHTAKFSFLQLPSPWIFQELHPNRQGRRGAPPGKPSLWREQAGEQAGAYFLSQLRKKQKGRRGRAKSRGEEEGEQECEARVMCVLGSRATPRDGSACCTEANMSGRNFPLLKKVLLLHLIAASNKQLAHFFCLQKFRVCCAEEAPGS